MKQSYKDYFKLGKNVIIAAVASLLVSAAVAQLLQAQENYLNTTFTLMADYGTFFSMLGILLFLENRKKYKLDSGQTDWPLLKKDLAKIITSLGIAEVIYTVFRWYFQFYFLEVNYDPYMASIIGQAIGFSIYMVSLLFLARVTRMYG